MPAENHTVNPSFNITTVNASALPTHLFINAGRQGISFVELEKESNTFISVIVYHFAKQLSDADIATALNNIFATGFFLQKSFSKADITWCFNESILMPPEFFEKNTAGKMLDMVYGDTVDGIIKNQLILKNNLYNCYKIPAAIENNIIIKFPHIHQNHQAGLLIDFEAANKDLLYCNFYTDSLTVLLRKNGQLQVIQNFEFTTPEDAVYHLLNVCRSFEVDATQNIVTASGMIDATSNLYNELYKYFAAVSFSTLPGEFNYSEDIKNYPIHYFSHLFATAACVL